MMTRALRSVRDGRARRAGLRTRLIAPLLTIGLAVAAAAQDTQPAVPTGKPLLWMIAGPTPSFLYGTIHVPDDRVLDVPAVVNEAIAACDAFHAELTFDITTMTSVAERMRLPPGKTLKDVLPPAVYARTARYLKSKGQDIAAFQNMKVWALMAQLALLDYLPEMATKLPLDMMLYTQALTAGKDVGGLETVEEQIAVFESLTADEHLNVLLDTLEQLEAAEKEGRSLARQLVDLYLHGDCERLMAFMHEYLDLSDPVDAKFFKVLIVDRNRRLAGRVAETLKREPKKSHFFAIGAAHFSGKDGLLRLLRARGLRLERLTPADADRVARD